MLAVLKQAQDKSLCSAAKQLSQEGGEVFVFTWSARKHKSHGEGSGAGGQGEGLEQEEAA